VHPSGRVIELPKGGCPWKEHLYRLEEEMGKEDPRVVFLLNVAEHNVNVSERERYFKCWSERDNTKRDVSITETLGTKKWKNIYHGCACECGCVWNAEAKAVHVGVLRRREP
jgi:hypothetical protein